MWQTAQKWAAARVKSGDAVPTPYLIVRREVEAHEGRERPSSATIRQHAPIARQLPSSRHRARPLQPPPPDHPSLWNRLRSSDALVDSLTVIWRTWTSWRRGSPSELSLEGKLTLTLNRPGFPNGNTGTPPEIGGVATCGPAKRVRQHDHLTRESLAGFQCGGFPAGSSLNSGVVRPKRSGLVGNFELDPASREIDVGQGRSWGSLETFSRS